MINKNQIIKEYKIKIKKFKKLNSAYFDKDKPLVSDQIFDK